MTSQAIVLGGVCILLIAGFLVFLTAWIQARSFLAAHDAIMSRHDLEDFKRVVKINMYLALAILAISGAAILLAGTGIYLGVVSFLELMLSLLVLGPLCTVAGVMMTVSENKMKKGLPVDPPLREEFEHVVKRWTSSAFPDW